MEEHWKSKIRSILLDEELSINGRHNRIMEVVEEEKKKAVEEAFEYIDSRMSDGFYYDDAKYELKAKYKK